MITNTELEYKGDLYPSSIVSFEKEVLVITILHNIKAIGSSSMHKIRSSILLIGFKYYRKCGSFINFAFDIDSSSHSLYLRFYQVQT